MKNKLLIPLILIILALILVYFLGNHSENIFPSYQQKKVKINNHIFTVYIADNDEKREQGLSYIKKLPENQGMLFIYNRPDYYQFWMKDMIISLDFIYLNNKTVVDLQENISPKTYPKSFTSKKPANNIIEVSAGDIKKYSIKIGDQIQFVE
ncbi:MAG TPA: DUF192 domain-containing protein [Candidatus Nitrosocosmicus sp.]|nr:DUF192 domain-containing protein [Candidatus Nitrosocosmicus sp.]